jgi:hypothetical protein
MFEMMPLEIQVKLLLSSSLIWYDLIIYTFLVVIGASEHRCHSIDDVVSLLKKGSNVRHTGATQMNDESSRSHAIFTLYIGINFFVVKQV